VAAEWEFPRFSAALTRGGLSARRAGSSLSMVHEYRYWNGPIKIVHRARVIADINDNRTSVSLTRFRSMFALR